MRASQEHWNRRPLFRDMYTISWEEGEDLMYYFCDTREEVEIFCQECKIYTPSRGRLTVKEIVYVYR